MEPSQFTLVGSCPRHRERERDQRRHPRPRHGRALGRRQQRGRGGRRPARPHSLGQRVPGREVPLHLPRAGPCDGRQGQAEGAQLEAFQRSTRHHRRYLGPRHSDTTLQK